MAFECFGIQLLTLNFTPGWSSLRVYQKIIRLRGELQKKTVKPKVNYKVPEFPWLLDFCVNNTTTVDTEKVDNFIVELIISYYYYYTTLDLMEASDQYDVTFIQSYPTLHLLHPPPPLPFRGRLKLPCEVNNIGW